MIKTFQKRNIRVSALYISLVMALIPFFNYSIGGRGLFLYLGIGMIVAFPLLGMHRYITVLTGLYFLFAMFELSSFLWAPSDGDKDWFQYLKIILYVLIIISSNLSLNETRVMLWAQILMGIIVTLILATTRNTMVVQGLYLTDTKRAILKIGNIQLDPNYTCMLFFPAAMYAWNALFVKCKIIYKMISLAYILVALYACLRTGSRGGIYALIIGSLYYFMINRGNSIRKFIILLFSIMGTVYILPYFINFLPNNISRRFSIAYLLASGGAGRGNYWVQCLNHIGDSLRTLLIGHGKGATLSLLGMNSHNFFIDTIYNGGIVELILLILFLCKIFKRVNASKNLYAKALFVCYLVMSFTVSVGTSIFFWTGILIVIHISNYDEFMIARSDSTQDCKY